MGVGPLPDDCVVGLSTRAGTNGPGVGDGETNGAGADGLAAGGGPIGEVVIRARDFQGFLPKSESISRLILYESKFSSSLHAVISSSVHFVGSSSRNVS